MSIFPQTNTATSISLSIPEKGKAREYAWDFEKDDFILKNGRPAIVEGLEAVKVWIYKALKTQRYRYMAYTNDFGQEYDKLIGQKYEPQLAKSEAERLTREALLIHPDIIDVQDFTVNIDEDRLFLAFSVNTTYGLAKMKID